MSHSQCCLFLGTTFTTEDFQNSKSYLWRQQSRNVPNYPETIRRAGKQGAHRFVNGVGNLPLNSPPFASVNCRALRTPLSVIHLSVCLCSVSVCQERGFILFVSCSGRGRYKRNRLTLGGRGERADN